MARRLPLALATLLFIGLGLHAYNQDLRIARLRADLEAVRAATGTGESLAEASMLGGHQPLQPGAQIAAERTAAVPPARPAVAAPAAAVPTPAPARTAVSQTDIDRVESAVLSLLEADRPELRAKLRAVVDEQRAAEEQERDERGRERYLAAMDSRLAEFTGPAALSPEQRRALLDIMSANRDQMIDIMRSADSAEAFSAARGKVQQLRDESDRRVKELLNEAQYEAYKQTQEREFGWGMGGPGMRPANRPERERGQPPGPRGNQAP